MSITKARKSTRSTYVVDVMEVVDDVILHRQIRIIALQHPERMNSLCRRTRDIGSLRWAVTRTELSNMLA
jgi:hypothetical protein